LLADLVVERRVPVKKLAVEAIAGGTVGDSNLRTAESRVLP